MKVVLVESLICQTDLKLISTITYHWTQLCSGRVWLWLNSEYLDMKKIYFSPIFAFYRALWNLPILPLTTSRTPRKVNFLTFRFHNYSFWLWKFCRLKTWISFSIGISFPLLPGHNWPGALIIREPDSEMSLPPFSKAGICSVGQDSQVTRTKISFSLGKYLLLSG